MSILRSSLNHFALGFLLALASMTLPARADPSTENLQPMDLASPSSPLSAADG
jgi:hypothetical protein